MPVFREIVERYSLSENISSRKILLILQNHNCQVSKTCWYRYCSGESVPSRKTMREVLNILNISFNEDELDELYTSSLNDRDLLKQLTANNRKDLIEQGVRIKVKLLTDDKQLSNLQIKTYLDERVKETSTGFSNYITRLIKNDLEKRVLPALPARKDNNK